MGGSPQPILVSLHSSLENKKSRRRSQGVYHAAGIKRRHIKISKRTRRSIKNSRMVGGLEGCRRPRNEVGRRVKVLKKLISSSSKNSLDGLFRDTANYILALEMKVKVMKIMVNALSTTSDDDGNNNK